MNARDELYAYVTTVFREDGVPPAVDRHVNRLIAKHRAEVLREAADFVGNDDTCGCGGCDTCVPRWLAAGLLRMADEATSGTNGAGEADRVRTDRGELRVRVAELETQLDWLRAGRAAVLLEAASALACLGPEDSLVSGPKAWDEAVTTLRRMAAEEVGRSARHGCSCGTEGGYVDA